ncbi:MAG: hypothetical protein N2V78_09325 [Methanophagales archaeon]|nr:hypothetical protein [Methanophagales archaeon]
MVYTLAELKAKFEEKLGISAASFDAKVAAYKEIYKLASPGTTEEQLMKLVVNALNTEFRTQLRSPAKHFVGMILGASTPFDTIAQLRYEALELWRTNPEKAEREGFVDAEGNPLDNRQTLGATFKNPRYGKPLPEHSFIKNIFGIAHPSNGEVMPFTMVLRDSLALENQPLFTPLSFRANVSTKSTEDMYVLNQSTTTAFAKTTEDMPDPITIINSEWLAKYRVPLAEIEAFHDAHTRRDILITTGDVAQMPPDPNAVTGNRMIVLDDVDRPEDKEQITVWVPEQHFPLLNFGRGSRIAVIGTTTQSTFGDPPVTRTMINAMGIYPIVNVNLEPAITGVSEAR